MEIWWRRSRRPLNQKWSPTSGNKWQPAGQKTTSSADLSFASLIVRDAHTVLKEHCTHSAIIWATKSTCNLWDLAGQWRAASGGLEQSGHVSLLQWVEGANLFIVFLHLSSWAHVSAGQFLSLPAPSKHMSQKLRHKSHFHVPSLVASKISTTTTCVVYPAASRSLWLLPMAAHGQMWTQAERQWYKHTKRRGEICIHPTREQMNLSVCFSTSEKSERSFQIETECIESLVVNYWTANLTTDTQCAGWMEKSDSNLDVLSIKLIHWWD